MKLSVPALLLTGTALLAPGCGEKGPTSPSETDPGSVAIFEVRCPEFGEGSRCQAYSETGDVSGLAAWSTSDPAIATVTSTGLVTPLRTGEVAIRASYRGATVFRLVWAVAGQGLHGTSRILQGSVGSMNGPLPGVVMLILNGPNAGRTTTTFANGNFHMADLHDGQFTIRLSKAGYRTAEYVWWIPGGNERHPTLSVAP